MQAIGHIGMAKTGSTEVRAARLPGSSAPGTRRR